MISGRKLLYLALPAVLLLGGSFRPPKGDVTVTVTGLRNAKGTVLISLFNNEKAFPGDAGRAVGRGKVPIYGGVAVVRFEGLPYGKYAAAILHDENSNRQMDYNVLRMPKEGFGFSNNVLGSFGPPSFQRAAFPLNAPEKEITIRLKYFTPGS